MQSYAGHRWPLYQRVKRVGSTIHPPDSFAKSLDSLTRQRGDRDTLLLSLSRVIPDFLIAIHDCRTNALISTCQPQLLALIFLGEFASKARSDREGLSWEMNRRRHEFSREFSQEIFQRLRPTDLLPHFSEVERVFAAQRICVEARVIVNITRNAICRRRAISLTTLSRNLQA